MKYIKHTIVCGLLSLTMMGYGYANTAITSSCNPTSETCISVTPVEITPYVIIKDSGTIVYSNLLNKNNTVSFTAKSNKPEINIQAAATINCFNELLTGPGKFTITITCPPAPEKCETTNLKCTLKK